MQSPDLNDIGSPTEVGFIPDGPGWYVVLGLTIVAVIIVSWAYLRYRKKNKYRRDAVKYLESISENPSSLLLANELMKRICLTFTSRQSSSLTGEDWINFLNSHCKSQPFQNSDAKKISAIYHTELSGSDKDFLHKTTRWVREHGF